jgi:hypothetical protein
MEFNKGGNKMKNNETETGRTIGGFKEGQDEKGNYVLKPIYLKETPKETIKAMNEQFSEWKTTKQIKYDKDGHRIEE